jgi:molybdopterin-guanine dinucleotide biosynthesis protein B
MPVPVISLVGIRGSGRREMLLALVGEMSGRGLRVSAVIGADDLDGIDRPGKDSHRHRDAGAGEVMVTSAKRWALIHGGDDVSRENDAVARMSPADLIIAEDAHGPAIEIRGAGDGGRPPRRDGAPIIAVVGDAPADHPDVPSFHGGDVSAIADFIAGQFGLTLS